MKFGREFFLMNFKPLQSLIAFFLMECHQIISQLCIILLLIQLLKWFSLKKIAWSIFKSMISSSEGLEKFIKNLKASRNIFLSVSTPCQTKQKIMSKLSRSFSHFRKSSKLLFEPLKFIFEKSSIVFTFLYELPIIYKQFK